MIFQQASYPPGALEGYTFTVRQIDRIDVRTEDGYSRARSLTVPEAEKLGFAKTYRSAVSDSEGQARFEGMKPGLYLIETEPPAIPGVKHKSIKPLLVLLPMTSKSGAWLDEVTIEVKSDNGITTPTPPKEIPNPNPTPTPTPPPLTTSQTPPPTTETTPDKPGTGRLPETGASVLGIIVIGLIMVMFGGLAIRRARGSK